MKKQEVKILSGYSIIHAIVDFCCAALVCASWVYYGYTDNEAFFVIVVYNVLAFALQAPFGFLVDKYRVPKESAFLGCVLILFSVFFFNIPALVAIFSGLGNAFFHVGGGSISLNINPQKATAPGVFVAPGAFGLAVGLVFGYSSNFSFWPIILLLLASCLFIYFSGIPKISYKTLPIKKQIRGFELLLLLLLLSVSIRGLYGLSASWKADPILLMLLTLGVVSGKALGGFLADRFGWRKIAIGSLVISAPLLAFFTDVPVLAIFGVFLFQMVMPIALTAISNILPGRSATAFGITVFALVLGATPIYLGIFPLLNESGMILTTVLLSALLLFFSFRISFRYFTKELKINL